MDMKKIGELIALQRKKLGYTQDELGNILNISGKAVSKWERGLSCPDASLMNRIAVELKISIAQLLDGKAADVALSSNALNGGAGQVPACAECGNIEISQKEDGGIVSPYLFGNNLEHTRSGVCGGISAQMLKNRKFVGKPSAMEGVAEGWYRPSCVADGIWTALMMHMIIGEAQTSGVGIACQFEAVNEGAIAVTPPRVYLTAAGQALALMKKHMNGILRFAGNFAVATEKEGAVTITVVNASYDESKNVTFSPKKSEVKATLYEGKSLLPHSCFEVKELPVRTDEKTCEINIPPHSIAIIQY